MLPQLLPRLFLIFFVSLVAIAVYTHLLPVSVNPSTTPLSLVGITLAVFLGLRSNASYDRYWETRRLWGQLLNAACPSTCQALTLSRRDGTNGPDGPNSGATDANVREFTQVLGALPRALYHQLCHTDAREDLATWLPAALFERVMAVRYQPIVIVQWMGEWVQRRVQADALNGYATLAFGRDLSELSNSIDGCECIADTSLPFVYSVTTHRTVYLFCAALPFGLVRSIGSFTSVLVVFVAYTFMAYETVASQLEDPLDMEGNDFAFDALSNTIENVVLGILSEPSPLPRAGVWRRAIFD